LSQLSILVVDDDKDVCEYLEDFLSHDGYRVVAISDPTQVVDVLRGDEFHICIVDLMMPKLSGIDLLGQIRKVDNDLAVIILTGYPSLETATASIEHDVSAYIKKPFSVDEFRGVIERIARKKGLVLRKEDELHHTIGRNIRELRKTRGLTLKQMSRRTKLSVSLLSQIERAESSASVSSLFKVATALDVRITELFGDF
jgi:DNA-binding NtrC family response regulator